MAKKAETDLYDRSLYINRELSWLSFNERCLEEAMDSSNPLLERVKFLAICYGNIKEDERTVDAPIGRHKIDRKKMCVTQLNSKPAVTHIKVLERYSGFTYILCRLETGRTHQIRVHLASIGHPLAGDDVYGPSKVITELGGQCLHAYKLGFVHPVTGAYMEFTADPPESFIRFREKLRSAH